VLDRVGAPDLVTWAPGPKDDVVRVRTETISGRRIERSYPIPARRSSERT
jgi:hypothetical protein